MPSPSADKQTVELLRRLASKPDEVWPSRQARSDMMAHNLTMADVCDAIIGWIDAQERVKPTVLHSFAGRVGQAAYEMKPRIDGKEFYVKVAVDDPGTEDERLALLSVHMGH